MNSGHATTFSILAVCTANICRSPMIELLLRKQLDPEKFTVGSAGVHGWNRAPVDSMVTMELARFGVRAAGFQSRALNDQLINEADLILAATRDHRAHILGRSPDALRKTFTLLEFAALMDGSTAEQSVVASPATLVEESFKRRGQARKDLDLSDPYRQGPDVHRAVAEKVRDAVSVIARQLADSAR
jgi:protein-tyrosine phosphatase